MRQALMLTVLLLSCRCRAVSVQSEPPTRSRRAVHVSVHLGPPHPGVELDGILRSRARRTARTNPCRCRRRSSRWTRPERGKADQTPPKSTFRTGCLPTRKRASRCPSSPSSVRISTTARPAVSPARPTWSAQVAASSSTTICSPRLRIGTGRRVRHRGKHGLLRLPWRRRRARHPRSS